MVQDERRVAREMLPLTSAVFHILLALADGEKHGYAIMQEIGERTGGAMHMGPGTLYGSIRRMVKDGLLVEVRDRMEPGQPGEERRRYYRLTTLGLYALQAEVRHMEWLLRQTRGKQVQPAPGEIGGA